MFCNLHPTAENLEISFLDSTHLTVTAKTSTTGPGYHIMVSRMVRSIAGAFGLEWVDTSSDEDSEYLDETGYFFSGEENLVYDEMLGWLKGLCGCFFNGTFQAETTVLCLPMEETFPQETDLALTPLGPRNRAWLEKVAEDPLNGKDFFAWWNPELDAEYFRRRALARMWREIRWRRPMNDKERETLQYCVKSLETAYQLDKALDYPWPEWAEMLEYLDLKNTMSEEVHSRAITAATIGYRRRDVRVSLPGYWTIQIPGSFSDLQYDDEGNTSTFDPPREVWVTSYSFNEPSLDTFERKKADIRSSNPELLVEAERYIGKAEIKKRQNDEMEWFVLSSSNVCVSGYAVCTIVFMNSSEREWAIDTWKSLRPPWTNNQIQQ